jgi:hypothetical protein
MRSLKEICIALIASRDTLFAQIGILPKELIEETEEASNILANPVLQNIRAFILNGSITIENASNIIQLLGMEPDARRQRLITPEQAAAMPNTYHLSYLLSDNGVQMLMAGRITPEQAAAMPSADHLFNLLSDNGVQMLMAGRITPEQAAAMPYDELRSTIESFAQLLNAPVKGVWLDHEKFVQLVLAGRRDFQGAVLINVEFLKLNCNKSSDISPDLGVSLNLRGACLDLEQVAELYGMNLKDFSGVNDVNHLNEVDLRLAKPEYLDTLERMFSDEDVSFSQAVRRKYSVAKLGAFGRKARAAPDTSSAGQSSDYSTCTGLTLNP